MDRRGVILRKHIIPAAHASGLQGTVEDNLIKRAVNAARELAQIRDQSAPKLSGSASSSDCREALPAQCSRVCLRGRAVDRAADRRPVAASGVTPPSRRKVTMRPSLPVLVGGTVGRKRQE